MIKDGTYRNFFKFELYEYAAIESFLSDMAMEGWMVESMTQMFNGAFFTFHEIEAKKIIFSVDICDKASMIEYERSDRTFEYIEYCLEAGWNITCSSGKIQILSAKDEKSLPIHTDEKFKLKAINIGMIFHFLPYLLNILLFILYYRYLTITPNSFMFEYMTINYKELVYFVLIFNIITFSITDIVDYCIWYFKAKNKIKFGKNLNFNENINKRYPHFLKSTWIIIQIASFTGIFTYSLINNFVSGKLSLILLLIILIVIIAYFYKYYFKDNLRLKTTKVLFRIGLINIIWRFFIAFIIFFLIGTSFINDPDSANNEILYNNSSFNQNNIPITLADLDTELLHASENSNSSLNLKETIFAKEYSFTSSYHYTSAYIYYTVYTSPYTFILNKYLDEQINGSKYLYSKVDPKSWDGNTVYTLSYINNENKNSNHIIVVYDNKIFNCLSEFSLNEDNIKLIRDKLDLYN